MTKKPLNIKNKQGKYKKGYSGNPNGRPKGSKNHNGLNACLDALKEVISREKNIKKLKEAFQQAFDGNLDHLTRSRLGFYFKFVMPLLPKDIDIGFKEDTLAALISQWEKNNGNK